MFLFKVAQTFSIANLGLVLLPDIGLAKANIGDSIKIIRPDKTIIETKIKGRSFNESSDILIEKHLNKEDVPIGSDVFLI